MEVSTCTSRRERVQSSASETNMLTNLVRAPHPLHAAYMYKNVADGQWWIDEPSGSGVYVALSDAPLPPTTGWHALQGGESIESLPKLEVVEA